jgi:hypothetical protein
MAKGFKGAKSGSPASLGRQATKSRGGAVRTPNTGNPRQTATRQMSQASLGTQGTGNTPLSPGMPKGKSMVKGKGGSHGATAFRNTDR